HGRFGEARRLSFSERLPHGTRPDQVLLADVTGTGAADVVVRLGTETWLFANGCGSRLEEKVVFRTRPLAEAAAVEAVDLLGTGVTGLLFTAAGGQGAWTYYALWQDKPDVLSTVD